MGQRGKVSQIWVKFVDNKQVKQLSKRMKNYLDKKKRNFETKIED